MDKKGKYLPLWGRYMDIFAGDMLTAEARGILLEAMMRYHFEGKEADSLPPELKGYWWFLRMDMDNAQDRYQTAVENGKKGGRKPRSAEAAPPKPTAEAPAKPVAMTALKTGTPDRKAVRRYGTYGWIELTREQYRQLELMMGPEVLSKCIRYVDQSAQTTGNRNKWQDWFVVLRRCFEGHWYEPKGRPQSAAPTGASGELGEAELEAIRQTMARTVPDVVIEEHPDTLPSKYFT